MIERKSFSTIKKYLPTDDILIIVGARQVGKTTLLQHTQKYLTDTGNKVFFITLEDPMILGDLNLHPQNIFNYIPVTKDSKIYLLIDEVQYLDNPSNFLKYHYDLNRDTLKIIASGSSAFYIDQKFKDSLAGRKKIVNIYPFSFSEFLSAKNERELALITDMPGFVTTGQKKKYLKQQRQQLAIFMTEYVRFGGYPKIVLRNDEQEKIVLIKELYSSMLKRTFMKPALRMRQNFTTYCESLLNRQDKWLTNLNLLIP